MPTKHTRLSSTSPLLILIFSVTMIGGVQAQLIDPNNHCVYYTNPGSCEALPNPRARPFQDQSPRPLAQSASDYDFLKRDNPFGSAEQPPQQTASGDFALCWTTGPVPNTKNMIITNMFQTQQTASTLKDELERYEQSQGTNVNFECTIDRSQQTQQSRFSQKISSFSVQGYNISQVQVRPH